MLSSYAAQFVTLSPVLQQYQSYWQLSAFQCTALPFASAKLNTALQQLDFTAVAALEANPAALQQFFAGYFPELFTLPDVPAAVAQQSVPDVPFWLSNGIGGRKMQQIDALCAQLPANALPVVEWCAGKGHLGRMLAQRYQVPVISIEWQQSLCDAGSALAAQYQLPQKFLCADVLQQPLDQILAPAQQVVALHACGQLHIRLLQQAVAQGCQSIQLVPCCYHLIPQLQYQPLSTLAQQHNLQLSKADLKLVVQGQVTAGARIEKLRSTEVLWRLAYDEYRADISGTPYQPLASVPKHWFSGDFAAFAAWAGAQHGLAVPADFDCASYLARGSKRLELVKRIELVQHLFRRPLELWLALDKVLFLEQHGYKVKLQQLCDAQITPRNLLLQAERRPS